LLLSFLKEVSWTHPLLLHSLPSQSVPFRPLTHLFPNHR
jgi:hypothetical protein